MDVKSRNNIHHAIKKQLMTIKYVCDKVTGENLSDRGESEAQKR